MGIFSRKNKNTGRHGATAASTRTLEERAGAQELDGQELEGDVDAQGEGQDSDAPDTDASRGGSNGAVEGDVDSDSATTPDADSEVGVEADTSTDLEADTASDTGTVADGADTDDGESDADEDYSYVPRRKSEPLDRAEGPFDESEVEGSDGRLDLGALWLPGRPGMELRLEVDQDSQDIIGVTAVIGASSVQLQAFAAPKSSGIWDEVRGEISTSILEQGGTADEVDGELGIALQTRMPGRGPDGRTVYSPVRFLGVDGPRWFLRAVLSGEAGSDPAATEALTAFVKDTVVVRGQEAMAQRELLGLRLPEEVTEDETDAEEAAQDDQDGGGDDLNPFERGPEITEIR